jgi:hypothetical protein
VHDPNLDIDLGNGSCLSLAANFAASVRHQETSIDDDRIHFLDDILLTAGQQNLKLAVLEL